VTQRSVCGIASINAEPANRGSDINKVRASPGFRSAAVTRIEQTIGEINDVAGSIAAA
jgi:hypothetical protein